MAMVLGPVLAFILWKIPTPDGLTVQGQAALATLFFCMVWWLFTPVALPVTSLVGLALLPTLGALPTDVAFSLFGNQAVFFVIGVFLIAAVTLQTGLSARISLIALRRFARTERSLCNGVLVLSWGLCSVVVSHAVAALILPILLGLLKEFGLSYRSPFARRLLLSMAWGTVAGSNLGLLSSARASLALELFDSFRVSGAIEPIGFLEYTLAAAPISLSSLLLAAVILERFYPEEGVELGAAVERLDQQLREKGPLSKHEQRTIFVIVVMIVTMIWVGPSWMGIVALLFCGVFFGLQLLRWEEAEKYVNWGVALLYGGAIAVGAAVHQTGAAAWVIDQMLPSTGLSPFVLFLTVGAIAAFFTELVSNSAVIAVLLPVLLALCEPTGLNPRAVTMLAPIAAGLAFVLPTSTPAMAMVFGVGYLRTRDTIPGILITIGTLFFLALSAYFWWPLIGCGPLEVL
ncbi:MAG: hypothetical protein CMK59_14960 [Proteobacteria bacterium]|nr:hypothetical protein [Pseudomonadota bacterium]